MPYIEEEDLLELHKQIERSKERFSRLLDQVDQQSKKTKRERKKKRIFITLFVLSLGLWVALGFKCLYIDGYVNHAIKPILCKIKHLGGSKATISTDSTSSNSTEREVVSKPVEDETFSKPIRNKAFLKPTEDKADSKPTQRDVLTQSIQEEKKSKKTSITYSVQIGTFENTEFKAPPPNFKSLWRFKDSFFTKYAIGNFQELSKARAFRKILVKLGFKDCFVISIKEGKRLRIENPY